MRSAIVLVCAAVMGTAACDTVTGSGDSARHVTVVSGDSQTVVVGMELPVPVEVEVRSANNRTVRYAPLFWQVGPKGGGAGGLIVSAEADTDGDGRARAQVQIGSTPGEYVVRAYAGQFVTEAGDTIPVQAEAVVFATAAGN